MAGRPVPQPAELLARAGFDALLKEALLHFDRIVVDSAPIHPVSDTLLLVQRVQTVCLVVRAHKTPRPPVHRAVQALLRAGAPVAGVIVNQLAGTRGEYYYDYSYYPEYVKEPAARA
jgi:Mrp family chromosome partitioning ATPase